MKKWTRWQDWIVVACGLFAALSVLWLEVTGAVDEQLLEQLGAVTTTAGIVPSPA